MSKPGLSFHLKSAATAGLPFIHLILAIFAVATLSIAQPARASAEVSQSTAASRHEGSATDLSSAHRQHTIHRGSLRRAGPAVRSFGNSMNSLGTLQSSEGLGYGYGYGDNSRNQTW